MCALVLEETGLLPHLNPGVMTREEIAGTARGVGQPWASCWNPASARLCAPGGAHYGSPDKLPAVRLETMRQAGELAVPFTTGILIGIGETRAERIEALAGDRAICIARYGHIQEVIVQNFRAKPDTKRGGCAGARPRRPAVDHRRGAADPAARDEHPGAAQSVARGATRR